ncbi:CD99 antigen-like protein 2 isoform X1 [Equus przewalskii]|uniref:CD99 antigen-like protein 2 n=1 Tax=Equus przewalskii TaxID=9798 RepID=A0ABM4N7Q2_EQUPR
MVAWRSAFVICLAFSSATLVQRGSGDFGNDFSVEDALKETSSVKQRWDRVTTTTKRPATTKAPAKPAGADLDLADALDDRNDPNDGRRKPSAGGGGFSDKDLEDIAWGGGYKPDKGKGDDPYGSNDDPASGMSAETGTIAGVASALAMALIGAVSSYISYQQKKFCFSIQRAQALRTLCFPCVRPLCQGQCGSWSAPGGRCKGLSSCSRLLSFVSCLQMQQKVKRVSMQTM